MSCFCPGFSTLLSNLIRSVEGTKEMKKIEGEHKSTVSSLQEPGPHTGGIRKELEKRKVRKEQQNTAVESGTEKEDIDYGKEYISIYPSRLNHKQVFNFYVRISNCRIWSWT